MALTAVSESRASGELDSARVLASGLGARHLTVRTRELDRSGYRANGRDRCYFCKSEVLDALADVARQHGHERLATGTNADDAADPHRPGISAGRERGVYTPLLDTALTKANGRAISRIWSLPTWNKPATPCLASRIRYGLEVPGISQAISQAGFTDAAVEYAPFSSGNLNDHEGMRKGDVIPVNIRDRQGPDTGGFRR